MLHALAIFLPVAALLAVTPGPATAMVVQVAARGGRRRAVLAMSGNATGLAIWAAASMLGVSALVVASETAYAGLKIAGAIVLLVLGIQAVRRARGSRAAEDAPAPRRPQAAYRTGLVTALTNPKVAVFYVALLPQFVPAGHAVLPATLLLATVHVSLSLCWYFVLASAVGYARGFFLRWRGAVEGVTGATMILFGLALAADRR